MAPDNARVAEIGRVLADIVKPARWTRTHPVDISANHIHGEPVPYEAAVAGPFEPFEEGDRWGPAWDTTWFEVRGRVPDDWAGQHVVLVVHLGFGGGAGFGAEGQVWVDGRPIHGISPNHREVELAAPAQGGERFELYIEAAANPPAIAADPGPMLAAEPWGEPLLELRRCHMATVDRDVVDLVRDWQLVADLAAHVKTQRASECAEALDRACAVIETDGVGAAAVRQARALLAEALSRGNDDTGRVKTHLAVGNSHLDTAWLWPLRETHRKAARTFSTAANMLDRNPDYRFAASQPQQLAWVRDEYPDLWNRLLDHVRSGRFEVMGAMWIEADCNIPSGESLVRQIVHGKRFIRDELGTDTDGLWLPDVFGYSAALPQILKLAGLQWFVTQKISWNDTNRFPHHTFWWEGIDGSRVFTHFPPADTYVGDFSVGQLLHGEGNFAQGDVRSNMLYLYGHGDGGAGPDDDMLHRARRLADLDGVGRVELVGAAEAIERLQAEGEPADLPVWVGELYLELHRGTYTTMGAIKKGNRALEWALRDAELWAVAAAKAGGSQTTGRDFDQIWQTVLLHQFHDILPGSSIHWVNDDTVEAHALAIAQVESLVQGALRELVARIDTGDAVEPVVVFNSLPFDRHETVDVDGVATVVHAPAMGWAVNDLAVQADIAPPVTVGDDWFDNGLVRVRWDHLGLLRSVVHKASGRDAIAPGEAANVLQIFDDRPQNYDAWDIDRPALDTGVDLTTADVVEVIEATPQRATLRVVRSFGRSRIEQHVRINRGSPRVEVHCEVDWHEDHKLLKVAFPVDVRAVNATHEIQFGHVERPTHANTSWDQARFETCAHTWVDLSESGFGVALLNDCKYGHDVKGNVIRLSLLRAPTWPDPVADRGRHQFAYALFAHGGNATEGGVVAQAHAFNNPLRVVPAAGSADGSAAASLAGRQSLMGIDDAGVVVSAVKPADDGHGVIVRLHEAFGGRRRVNLTIADMTSASRTNLLEEPLEDDSLVVEGNTLQLDLAPFEIVTLRLQLS